MRKIESKYVILVVSILVLLLFIVGKYFIEASANVNIFPNLHYWLWLAISAGTTIVFGIKSRYILVVALVLTILGGALSVLDIGISGYLLRLGFVFWILGYVFNLREIMRSRRKEDLK